jgi:excisionase family DNA binding protein
MEFESSKLLYKSSEVAKLLGVTTTTLKKLVLTGKIQCLVVNTHRYFTKEHIKEYIEKNTLS